MWRLGRENSAIGYKTCSEYCESQIPITLSRFYYQIRKQNPVVQSPKPRTKKNSEVSSNRVNIRQLYKCVICKDGCLPGFTAASPVTTDRHFRGNHCVRDHGDQSVTQCTDDEGWYIIYQRLPPVNVSYDSWDAFSGVNKHIWIFIHSVYICFEY
jgi:hypothetical protein